MRAYALIPARSGSKGLPHKNILPLAGHPLLAHSIAFARHIPVERVLLSTDSPRYAEIGRAYGAEVPGLRGAAASGDTAMEEDILAELEVALPARGIPLPDIWVWLKPTCPFRDPAAVAEAFAILRDRPEVDAVRIVSEADARLHRINADGWLEPLLESWDSARSKMRRSEFPKVFQPFNLEVFRHAGWRARGALFMGRRIHPIVLPRITGLDVDDGDGFELIRTLVEARPRPALVARHLVLPPPPKDPRATRPVGELWRDYHAANAAERAALLEAVMRREAGQFSQDALDLARFDPGPLVAASEAILADFPIHRVALRSLAWCRGRLGDADGARAVLGRLLEAWPDQEQDSRREMLRLHLLGTHDPAAREADWRRYGQERGELSRLSYLVQRAVAEDTTPDLSAFEALLAARVAAALARPAGEAAEALGVLRAARSVALVGNGPGLKGSGAARAIEAHDIVLRLNYPMIFGHEADVGTRTDLMIFDGSHRARLAERIDRHPSFPTVPALGTYAGPMGPQGPLYAGPPDIPAALRGLVDDLCYARRTTGMKALVLSGLVLGKPVTLFGFDFFRPGGPGHYYDAAAAPFTHETGYERWFVERLLPLLCPVVRLHQGA